LPFVAQFVAQTAVATTMLIALAALAKQDFVA
jgi:hypothetical protein